MLFGELIKKARIEQGLRLEDLGSKQNMSKLEKEERSISYEAALELAKTLKIAKKTATIAYLNSFMHRKNIPYKASDLTKVR